MNLKNDKQTYEEIFEKGEKIFSKSKHLTDRILYKKDREKHNEEHFEENTLEGVYSKIESIYLDKMLDQMLGNKKHNNILIDENSIKHMREEMLFFFKAVENVTKQSHVRRKKAMINLCERWNINLMDSVSNYKDDEGKLRVIFNAGLERLNHMLELFSNEIEVKAFIVGQNLDFENFLDKGKRNLREKREVLEDFRLGICRDKNCRDNQTTEYRKTYDDAYDIYKSIIEEVSKDIPEDEVIPSELVFDARQQASTIYMLGEITKYSEQADIKLEEFANIREQRFEVKAKTKQ